MKKLSVGKVLLAMLGLAACSLSTPASAQSKLNGKNAEDKIALVQRYYWYEELLASANSEDVIAMQTDDFVNVPINSKAMNREQSNAMVRLNADSVHRVHGANITINKLDIYGAHAIATVTQFFDSDNQDASGVIRRVTSNMVARQLWTRTENGWQIQRSKTLRAEININGHIVRI